MNIVIPSEATGHNIPCQPKGDAYKHIPRALSLLCLSTKIRNLLDSIRPKQARRGAFPYVSLSTRPTASGIILWPGVDSHQTSAKGMACRLGTDREKGIAARRLQHVVSLTLSKHSAQVNTLCGCKGINNFSNKHYKISEK